MAVGALLAASFGLSPIAGWIPRTVSAVTLLLIFIQFGLEMREHAASPPRPAPAAAQPQGNAATPAEAVSWIAGALLAVLALGIAAGSALFAFAWLRRSAAESRTTSALFALALGASLQLFFGVVLQATLYKGWLWPG